MVVVVTERALAAASLYMDAVVRGTGRKQSTAQQRLAMTRTHARTHIRTHAHTHIRTHAHTHTHKHTLVQEEAATAGQHLFMNQLPHYTQEVADSMDKYLTNGAEEAAAKARLANAVADEIEALKPEGSHSLSRSLPPPALSRALLPLIMTHSDSRRARDSCSWELGSGSRVRGCADMSRLWLWWQVRRREEPSPRKGRRRLAAALRQSRQQRVKVARRTRA